MKLLRGMSTPDTAVAWLLMGGLGIRCLVALFLLPGFDEAYYYLYSRYLHWSYFDHPPIVALTTGLGWWLTGVIAPFTIRLGALVMYLVSLGLLYWTAVRLFSAAVGRLVLAIATLIPLFMLGFGILTSPDNGLILFWTAALAVATVEFFPDPETVSLAESADLPYVPTWRLTLLGLLVGLACLSKYHGFVLALSLVGFCLSSDRYRRALWSPWMGLALIAFALSLFPLWFWNFQHDWISFRFQLSMRFDGAAVDRTYSWLQMVGYWLINIAYLFPAFGFPLWWITARQGWTYLTCLIHPPADAAMRHLNQKRSLILWVSLPIMLGFTWLGGSQQILPAWPAPGFWGMTILLGAAAATWPRKVVSRWLWISGYMLVTLLAIALLHLTLGIFQQPGNYSILGGFLSPQQDPSTELIDTQQLQRRLAAAPEILAALQEVGFVFTNEYYLGGYLDMAIHPLVDVPVTCFSQDPRGFAFWFNQADWLGQDALYVTLERFYQDPAISDRYRQNFADLTYLGSLPLTRGGTTTEVFHFYQGQQFRQLYDYPY